MNLENKKLSVSVSYDASSNSHRTGTKMNCRNFYSVQFHAEKKNGAGKAAVTLTDTYRWRSRMPFSRQIPAIHPAIRNIKMARRDKLIS